MFDRIRKTNDDAGFTLIELVVVMVTVSALSGIAVFSVGGLTDHVKLAACRADVTTVRVAGEAYTTLIGYAAPTMDELVTAGFLRSKPADVAYTVAGGTFTVAGVPACG